MESHKDKILTIIFFLCLTNAMASNRSEIYHCYITGDMSKWKIIIDRMASENYQAPAEVSELINYQYGYIGWCVGAKRDDEAKRYLGLAEENLKKLSSYPSYQSLVNAYKAAFYGYRIGLNKILAPFLGNKSLDCARNAIKQDETNQFAWVQLGNSEFYMPSAFGGSKAEALKYYTRAQKIMESDKSEIKESWNYLSLLTVIAQAYSYTGEYDKSKQYLDKILGLEPDFAWVKNELYKQLYSKMKN